MSGAFGSHIASRAAYAVACSCRVTMCQAPDAALWGDVTYVTQQGKGGLATEQRLLSLSLQGGLQLTGTSRT